MAYYPASNTVQELTLTANVALVFPYSGIAGVEITDIIDVDTAQNGFNIFLPDATVTQPGFAITFNNVSQFSFSLFLNDTTTFLTTINSGIVLDIYLIDNSTTNGTWRTISSGLGASALSSLNFTSNDNSVQIQNSNITPPGGTVDLTLPQIISSLMNLENMNTPGYLVVTGTDPFTYELRTFQNGPNIAITQPGGTNNNTLIDTVTNLVLQQLTAGNVSIQGNIIQNTDSDGILAISTQGDTSLLMLNNVDVDINSNVSNINNLSINGSFNSPNVQKAWCRFSNTAGTIVVESAVNVENVTFNSTNFQYLVTFTNPMGNTNYGIEISCSNSGTPPNLVVRLGYDVSRSINAVSIVIVDGSGQYLPDAPDGVTVSIMSIT